MNLNFQPLISIIIPVYNGGSYLQEAIDSALNQTYKNIEVIIINDGSTDAGKTEDIAIKFGNKITYISKPNGGVASALNTGIKQAGGQYISWLSHDDVYHPTKLETQVKYLSDLDDKNCVLYSNYDLIDENSKLITTTTHDHQMLVDKPLYAILRGCLHGCSMLISKQFFIAHGYFDETLKTTQDYDLWFKMAMNKVQFIHMPDVLIQSRWHDQQDSKTNPNTLREANELWVNFTKELTDDWILSCESSPYMFYKKLAEFLKNTPYTMAYKHALNLQRLSYQQLVEFSKPRKVSVIIPFHNRISWLLECLKSVTAQTHQHLEILLINNNSTDCLDELKAVISEDSRIILLHEKQQGPASARNLGLNRASGDYVSFVDSDDLWIETKVEQQLMYMLLEDKYISYTGYHIFDEKGNDTEICHGLPNYTFPEIIKQCRIALPTVMMDRKILKKYQLKFPSIFTISEDICLWITISKYTDISFLEKSLTRVRLHGNNAAYCKQKQYIGLINVLAYVINQYPLQSIQAEVDYLLKLTEIYKPRNESSDTTIKSFAHKIVLRRKLRQKLVKIRSSKIVRAIYYKLPPFLKLRIRKIVSNI